ncbi:MAG TPA: SidA/IucD/PvdA family monooxygenase [Pseudonocardiaceae bacterium]
MRPLDIAAVGAGPFNLALAALADGVPGLRVAVFEQASEFRWHPGMLIEDSTLQVPFLADLVTLVDPTSRWSFLNYLRARGRLFPFYFAERFHVPRAEYDDYCRWVADGLGSCHFGQRIGSVRWDRQARRFNLDNGVTAGHVVLGIGTEPVLPRPLRPLTDRPPEHPANDPAVVVHSADYLRHRDALTAASTVAVVGAGQSGAEVFLDLLRRRPHGLRWLARTQAFAPMEYSKLGLEQFTPDHTAYFHGLPEKVRDALLPTQWQLYKGVSAHTLGLIHDELYELSLRSGGWPDVTLQPGVAVTDARRLGDGRIELGVQHEQQGTTATVQAHAVVAATGYRERPLDGLLAPLVAMVGTDDAGRPLVGADYRLDLGADVTGGLFVQNAERHTHGVGAPDLGLAAWRAAVILNAVCGREVYPLPRRTAFTTFGLGAGR